MNYLSKGVLPEDSQVAAKVAEASLYTMADGILYYIGQKKDSIPKVVVPSDYKKRLMEEITLELCQAISPVPGYTRPCHVNGGGNIRIKTLSIILVIVHNVP